MVQMEIGSVMTEVSLTASLVTKKASGDSFAGLLSSISGKNANTETEQQIKQPETEKAPMKSGQNMTDRKVSNEARTESTDTGNETAGVQEAGAKGEVPEEIIEKVSEVVATVIVRFAITLQVTVDELLGSYEQLGIDPSKMLDTDSLVGLVLNLNGTDDISSLLTDGKMSEMFDSLRDIVSDVLEEVQLTVDEFSDALSGKSFDSILDESALKIADKAAQMFGVSISEVEELLQGTSSADQLKQPVMTDKPERTAKTGKAEKTELTVEKQETVSEGKALTAAKGSEAKGSDQSDEAGTEEMTEDILQDEGAGRRKADRSDLTSFEGFVAGMEKAITHRLNGNASDIATVNVRDIVYRIVDEIKVSLSPEKNTIELSLTPESLGKVQLSVSSKDGVMTARIVTESDAARAAVEGSLETLKQTINEQGFKVESIEVTVSNFSFADSRNAEANGEEQTERQNGGHRIGNVDAAGSQIADTPAEELREKEIMLQNGSTVSFVA